MMRYIFLIELEGNIEDTVNKKVPYGYKVISATPYVYNTSVYIMVVMEWIGT